MSCELRTLLFTDQPARAQVVRLQSTWQRIISGHNYPAQVQRMLGELVAASSLLSASLKFNGSLVLQLKGDGPIRLLVAECSSDLGIRATAMFDPKHSFEDGASFHSLVNAGGQGRFVMILDPRDRLPGQQPYQGIIGLEGNSLAQTIESYMQQSEQLQTRLWLDSNESNACGLLLQQMPGDGGILAASQASERPAADPAEDWPRLILLSDTLKPGELLQHEPGTIAHRLFWQEPHQTLAVRQPVFHCTCSREKVARMLRSLGEEEVADALKEQGRIEVNCDYCNTLYRFDAVDCKALFVETGGNFILSDEYAEANDKQQQDGSDKPSGPLH
jgi:molecular chaperone Hsp33